MMILVVVLLMTIPVLGSTTTTTTVDEFEDVLWFAGQSNMTGASNNIGTGYTEFLMSKEVYEWNVLTRSRQKPQEPVIHSFAELWVESVCKDNSDVSCENSRNMVASVASSYSNKFPSKTVIAVNTSFKGSGFATVGCGTSSTTPSWGPTDNCNLNSFLTSLLNNGITLRENALNSVIDCLKARSSGRLKALIWFQGENGNTTQEDLRTLFTYWRTTLHSHFPHQGYGSMPIVIVQTGIPTFPSYDEQVKYAASDTNAHLLDLQDLYTTSVSVHQNYGVPSDTVHFSATALTTIITERVVTKLLSIL